MEEWITVPQAIKMTGLKETIIRDWVRRSLVQSCTPLHPAPGIRRDTVLVSQRDVERLSQQRSTLQSFRMGCRWVSPQRAAKLLGVDQTAIYHSIANNTLSAVCSLTDRRIYVSRDAVEVRVALGPGLSPEEWVSTREASQILGLCLHAIHHRIDIGELPALRGGSRKWPGQRALYVRRCDIETARQSSRIPSGPVFDKTFSDADLGWLAGMLDGEGCIRINRSGGRGRNSPHHALSVSIKNTHFGALERLQRTFGGSLGPVEQLRGERRKPTRTWTISSRSAAKLLELALPHLTIKSEQAQLAVEFQQHIEARKTRRCTRIPQEEIDWRDQQMSLISLHRQRWRSPHD